MAPWCACRWPIRCTTGLRRDVETIKGWLAGIDNLQQVGRNGLHRYNNSDHSMLTAMRAVDNLLLGADNDLWAVNADSVYHEEDDRPSDPNPYPYRDDRVTSPLAASET